MYGLISKLKAQPGQRDALVRVLLQGSHDLPGCVHYIVSRDVHDHNIVWVVETWESTQAHHAALTLPAVMEAMAQGRPLIAAIDRRIETLPVTASGGI